MPRPALRCNLSIPGPRLRPGAGSEREDLQREKYLNTVPGRACDPNSRKYYVEIGKQGRGRQRRRQWHWARIAQRFLKEGAHLFIFGRRREALDESAQLIGANVTAIQVNATKLEDLDRVADAVRSAKGKVNVVVSKAALVEHVPPPEMTPDHYDRTFALNARAPLFLVQKVLPMMGRGGSIILVSSAMHYMGLANHSTYAATKAALRSYSRTWAAEFKDSGI